MKRSDTQEMRYTLITLSMAIERLSEKVDSCQGMCEAVMDEVVPITQALDTIAQARKKGGRDQDYSYALGESL